MVEIPNNAQFAIKILTKQWRALKLGTKLDNGMLTKISETATFLSSDIIAKESVSIVWIEGGIVWYIYHTWHTNFF